MFEKVNINTIAKLSGVSTTTVSNFINCTEVIPISTVKRSRIMEAMRTTNYRPSNASSQLRRNSILPGKAVFIFGGHPECNPFETSKNPMLGELITSIEKELRRELGLTLEIKAVEDENSTESWNETIADAEMLVCYGKLDAKLLEISTRRNIPLVLVSDNKSIETRGIDATLPLLDCVYWDGASHLEKILTHVVDKGAKRLAFVSSWNIKQNHPVGFALEAEAKIAEFKAFIAANPELSGELLYPPMPDNVSPYYEGRNVYEFIRKMDLRQFDAIIGHNDFVAQGIIGALRDANIVPGQDILVCGEGDYAECRYSMPTVTTASYDKQFLAENVCNILRRRMVDNQPHGEHILIPSFMHQRESTERNTFKS